MASEGFTLLPPVYGTSFHLKFELEIRACSCSWNPGSKTVCPVYTITMNLLDIPIPFIQISTSTEWQFNVYEFLER